MSDKHIIDISSWPRREHYTHFGMLEDPFFGITAKADFTDMKHAGGPRKGQSIPRISTGMLVPSEERLMMSVSVELNHGLADGYHVAQFFRLLGML